MEEYINDLIREALKEDIGTGDITSEFIFEDNFTVKAVLTAKEDGIICGTEIFKKVFLSLSPDFEFSFNRRDGDTVQKMVRVAELNGPVKEMMAGERTALNFLQHLSGIATAAHRAAAKSTGIEIFDTRKTTPLLRRLEKYAVKTGGGKNHRFGLYDMVLIKENHIHAYMQKEGIQARPEAIEAAVGKARSKAGSNFKVEVEVENFSEAKKALLAGADIIMFDNASKGELERFTSYLGGNDDKIIIEWSGNVNIDNINSLKGLPVDRVSIGELTHSAKALDFSLKTV